MPGSTSRFFICGLIIVFLFFITAEHRLPGFCDFSEKKSDPVVRVKEAGQKISPEYKKKFDGLIEEGKRLFQEKMNYNGAIAAFRKARAFAKLREHKAEALFYLALVLFTAKGDEVLEECRDLIRELIEIDYFRQLDGQLCPPAFFDLAQQIKKDFGVLRILSSPSGADVFVSGQKDSVGKTPLVIGVRKGEVSIEIKKNGKSRKERFTIEAGRTYAPPLYVLKGKSYFLYIAGSVILTSVVIAFIVGRGSGNDLETGRIQVNSNPTEASVYLDGAQTGRITNCLLSDVSAGTHTLSLVKEGYLERVMNVTVTAGQTETVSVTLEAHSIIVSEPTGETVWEIGEEVQIAWTVTGSSSNFPTAPLFGIPSTAEKKLLKGSVTSKGERAVANRSGSKGLRVKRKFPSFINPMRSLETLKVLVLSNIRIELYKGDVSVETIASRVSNNEGYTWVVSDYLAEGRDYKIRVSCADRNSIYGESSYFSIIRQQ
jgi:hypothetical protein